MRPEENSHTADDVKQKQAVVHTQRERMYV